MAEGRKNDEEKLRMDLIPVLPLRQLADVYTRGAKKYGDRNWENGIQYSRIYAALLRHVTAWWNGEEWDPEDGQHHLASVAWCAFALMEYRYRPSLRKMDDRPSMSHHRSGDLAPTPNPSDALPRHSRPPGFFTDKSGYIQYIQTRNKGE